ncbi:MAG: hypothetical protein ABL867_08345 [Rickettsiales bacterium]
MSHVQQVTKPTLHSAEAVHALIKYNALAHAEKAYIVPIPEGNDILFLKEAKEVLSNHLDNILHNVNNPNINRRTLEENLKKEIDSKKWSEDQQFDVLLAANAAVSSLDRQLEVLANFSRVRAG